MLIIETAWLLVYDGSPANLLTACCLIALLYQVEIDIQQENKRPSLKDTGESVWNDCALQARCENVSQGHSNTDSLPIDALKNRMSSLMLTASQALENQHRTMSTVVYENEFRAR